MSLTRAAPTGAPWRLASRPGLVFVRGQEGGGAGYSGRAGHKTDSTHSYNLLLGSAPTLVAATFPLRNRIMVGIPRTPYFVGASGFSSILTLATVNCPALSAARSSRNGAIILHGPHHSAQKSTNTGPSARSTRVSKSLSVTVVGFIALDPSEGLWAHLGAAPKPRQGA